MEKTVQCVVICLNRERQRCMERQIKNLGITFPVHYLEASVPENTGSYFPQNTSLRDKRHMCCARSHNRAVQYASQDSSADFTVIIEDDVGIHKTDFIRTVKELASRWSEITAQGKHSVVLGWIPDNNYKNYSIHAKNNATLKATNPDILFFDIGNHKRHVYGTQTYMIEKTYAKQVSAVLMKDTFQEMCESIHKQKYRFLDPSNNLLGIDFYIHHAFSALVSFPPLAIEFKTEEQVNPQNELGHWVPFFKGYEAKREEYWKPGGKIALFTNGKDDYEQALLPQLHMEIVCVLPNTDASVYKDIHKVILGSYTPADPLTGKHITRLITTNPLIDDIERYTNNLKCTAHTPNELWLKGNLAQYTSYLETLYNVPVVLMPALKPPRIPENPPYKAKAEETALDIVIMEKNTNFNTSGWKALTICEQLYLQDPERIHQVFFINTPKENPTSMGMIGSLKLKQDGKLRLFNAPTTAEIIQYFLTVSNNVVFLSNQIFDDMNYGYYAVVQTGFPLVHSSSELRTAGIGRYYDSNNMLEAVGHLREPFARKVSRVPKLVHQTWETKDLPPAMKATFEYNQTQNPDFKFILYDDDDRIQFIQTHFDTSVVKAYHTLVPGAYRADLFRYCVLYVLGGIYMDVRFKCAEGFRFTEITEPQYVKDRTMWGANVIYNGFMVSKASNTTLYNCIQEIVKNCENATYGQNPLCPTGPYLLGKYVKEETNAILLMKVSDTVDSIVTIKEDRVLLTTYKEYYEERKIHTHYWGLWEKRQIYGEVNIGTSESDTKLIKLHKSYPAGWECIITKHGFPDRFETSVNKDILTVKRMDHKGSWAWPHKGRIVPHSVPKLVHQTWETKDLPPAMKATFEYNQAQNPEFEFILYDDDDRIAFIQKHFDRSVLNAYHTLVPGAYRADLFRYCVLYVLGGIYMDVRFQCAEGFRLAEIAEPQYVRDMEHWGNKDTICNGLIVSNPINTTLFKCIQEIVINCKGALYGNNPFWPTGPCLLGKYVKEESMSCVDIHISKVDDQVVLVKNKRIVMITYTDYNKDRSIMPHYYKMWENSEIYGEVKIGTSTFDTKIIKLHKFYPEGWECVVHALGFPDRFETSINKDILIVKRIDSKSAWGWPHKGRIVPSRSYIQSEHSITSNMACEQAY